MELEPNGLGCSLSFSESDTIQSFHDLIFQRNYSVASLGHCRIFAALVRPKIVRIFRPPPSGRKDRLQGLWAGGKSPLIQAVVLSDSFIFLIISYKVIVISTSL